MNCPVCNVELRMGDRFGIELDYCPQCRGIWLEKGKLDQMVQRSSSVAAPAQPAARPEYPDGYRDHGHDHHDEHGYEHGHEHDRYGRRKKSFFSDLFD